MKVLRAQVLGFCSGVRRAVNLALGESGAGRVYTLGPLIHNPTVLKELAARGVGVLNDKELPSNGKDLSVIIRAHGVSPFVENKLVEQSIRTLDATCVHVKESQKKARHYAGKGYRIFLAGEKNHGEIAGISGYAESAAPDSCFVVGNAEEAARKAAELYSSDKNANTVLIGQTTFSAAAYKTIEDAIRKYFANLTALNTICGATEDRQKALAELCGKVDAVIIAGGKESSNSKRLLALALELGKPAWLVESAEELKNEVLPSIHGCETIGLSAGASTPDSVIDEIERMLTKTNLSVHSKEY